MPLLNVSTPFNIELEFALATFGKRLLSWLIDLLVQYCYAFVMLYFIFSNIFSSKEGYTEATEFVLIKLVIILPALLYPLLMEVFNNGRTVGKMLMGLKVLNKEGASPTLSQYALRWMINVPNFAICGLLIEAASPFVFIYILMIAGFMAIPAAISIAVTNYSQRLADLAAGTVVVDYKYRMHIADTIYMDVSNTEYKVVFPDVLKLSDRDINGIRNLLNNKPNKDTENFMLRVALRIEEVLQIKMNGTPRGFLHTLMKDYNYLTQNN